MVKIEFTEAELNIVQWAVKRQLDRLLQAKQKGHKVDENTIIPILKRLKEKTSVKSAKEESELSIVT